MQYLTALFKLFIWLAAERTAASVEAERVHEHPVVLVCACVCLRFDKFILVHSSLCSHSAVLVSVCVHTGIRPCFLPSCSSELGTFSHQRFTPLGWQFQPVCLCVCVVCTSAWHLAEQGGPRGLVYQCSSWFSETHLHHDARQIPQI